MGLSVGTRRQEDISGCWRVPHGTYHSEWAKFVLQRYRISGANERTSFAPQLPRLLRSRVRDWSVESVGVRLGHESVYFGRELRSPSVTDCDLVQGVQINFGANKSGDWWYAQTTEWELQFHRGFINALNPNPEVSLDMRSDRFFGTPHWIGAEPPESLRATQDAPGESADADADSEAKRVQVAESPKATHIMTLWFTNEAGHPGMLSLPVLEEHVPAVKESVERWNLELATPMSWAGLLCEKEEEFDTLASDTDLGVCDLVLLGVEHESAMTLFQDSSWGGYAQGSAEVTTWSQACDVERAVAEAETPGETPSSQHGETPAETPRPQAWRSSFSFAPNLVDTDTNEEVQRVASAEAATEQHQPAEASPEQIAGPHFFTLAAAAFAAVLPIRQAVDHE